MKTYRGFAFRAAVEAVAYKIAADFGVTLDGIVWQSMPTAAINSRGTLFLADVPNDAVLTQADVDRYAGFIVHELLHRVYTDFNVHAEMSDALRFGISRVYLHQLHNAVEDAYIERRGIAERKTGNIEGLLSALLTRMVRDSKRTDWTDPACYPWIFAVHLRDHVTLKTPVPTGLQPIIDGAHAQLVNAQSSGDTYLIALWIAEQLQSLSQDGEDGESDDGQDDSQDGEQGQDGKTGEDGEQGDGQDGEQGDGETESGEGQDGESDGEGDGEGEGTDGESDGESGEGEGEGEGEGTESGEGEGKTGNARKPERGTSPDEVEPTLDPLTTHGGVYNEDANVAANFMQWNNNSLRVEFTPTINAGAKLRHEVRRLFENTAREDHQRGLRSGAVNVASLARVNVTDRVFHRRREEAGIDSAVIIAIDVSGSMYEYAPRSNRTFQYGPGTKPLSQRIISAIDTAVTLHDTLTRAGVAVQVMAFGDNVACVAPWNTPTARLRTLLQHLGCDGSTNDYFAVRYCHTLLARRPEQRKMLISITDAEGDIDQVKHEIASGEALGITTVGIGVCVDISAVYAQSVKVMDPTDLGKTSFAKIKLAA